MLSYVFSSFYFKSCYLYSCYCKDLPLQSILQRPVNLMLLKQFFYHFMMKHSKGSHYLCSNIRIPLLGTQGPSQSINFLLSFPTISQWILFYSQIRGLIVPVTSYTLCSSEAHPLIPFTIISSSSIKPGIAKVWYAYLWCHTI